MLSIVDCTLPSTGTGLSLMGLAMLLVLTGAIVWRLPRAHRGRVMLAIAVPLAALSMNVNRASADSDACPEDTAAATEDTTAAPSTTAGATTTTIGSSGTTTTTTTTTDPGTTTTTDPGTTTTTDPGSITTDPSTTTTSPAVTYSVTVTFRNDNDPDVVGSGWGVGSVTSPATNTVLIAGTYDTSKASDPTDPSTFTISISGYFDAYKKGTMTGGTCKDFTGTSLSDAGAGSWQSISSPISCVITGNFAIELEVLV